MSAPPTTATVAVPRKAGYHASLNDLLLRLAGAPSRPLLTETSDLTPPRFQTEANPQDVMAAFGDVHSQSDFSGGEGLFNRFRRRGDESDVTRFWASEHVSVSPAEEGRAEEIRLLTQTERVDAISGTVRIAHTESTLWATSGTTLRKTTDVLAATPTFTNDDPHAGEVATIVGDVALLGTVKYAALGSNGIHRDTGAGWAHWSDVLAVRAWSALDRVIASTGTALYEAAAGATSVLLYTLPAGEEWTDVIDAGGAILAAATNGFVYVFTLDDTAALVVTGQSKLKGETPRALAARGDVVFVGTSDADGSARLWMGDGPGLANLRLLRDWDDATVRAMAVARDQLIIGVTEAGAAWTWRLELATTGLSKGHRLGSGTVHGLAMIEGKTVAGVSTDGVYRQNPTLQPSGWLIGTMSDFFRADEKSWVTGWADVAVSGGQVVLYFTTDRAAMSDPNHPSWRRLRTYTTSSEGVEVGLGGVKARALAGMVKIEAAGDNTSPAVRSMSFRSYPGPGDVIVRLPVDVGDQVERHGRRRLHVRGRGVAVMLPALRDLEGQEVLCRVFRTGDVVRGLVESVATPVPAFTPRGSPTQVSMVTVRGRRVADLTEFTAAGWGGFAWGDAPWGGSAA